MERETEGIPIKVVTRTKIPKLTPAEQAEREGALERMLRRRAELPPLEVSTVELVHLARQREAEERRG